MDKKKKYIHARIKTIGGQAEVTKFSFVEKLPNENDVVDNTRYHYGKAIECELSAYQKTRDDDVLDQYSFYILPIYDDKNNYMGRSCLCTPHQKSTDITPKIFNGMIEMAREYKDVDDFIRNAMVSSLWEEEDVDQTGREEWLKQIYIAANRDIKDIIALTKMSQVEFGAYFGMPRRTIENWCMGKSSRQSYLLIMMQEILGFVTRN